jgi:hypothetical protein
LTIPWILDIEQIACAAVDSNKMATAVCPLDADRQGPAGTYLGLNLA